VKYKILGRHEEDPAERIVVDVACEVAARKLSIEAPTVRFIAESSVGELETDRPVWGLQRRRSVYLLKGLAPTDLVTTTAHECQHVADYDRGLWSHNTVAGERMARLFGMEFGWEIKGSTYRQVFHSLEELRYRAVYYRALGEKVERRQGIYQCPGR
jgi:hypothetical protein